MSKVNNQKIQSLQKHLQKNQFRLDMEPEGQKKEWLKLECARTARKIEKLTIG